MPIVDRLLDLIAPHYCLGCQREGYVLCSTCAGSLPTLASYCYRCGKLTEDFKVCASCRKQSALSAVLVGTTYDGTAKRVVHRLKYERARAAGGDVAAVLAGRDWRLPPNLVVTHVPTANARVRIRGYDQAALIARHFARERSLPYLPVLARIAAARQVGASREQRRSQMLHAFRPVKLYAVQNADVLLIDDVLTTGSTLEAAAATLKQAGARRVYAAVFARA